MAKCLHYTNMPITGYDHEDNHRWRVELERVKGEEARQAEAMFNEAQIS
jgi:hypothetical protein